MLCPVCSDTEAAPEESRGLELLMVAPSKIRECYTFMPPKAYQSGKLDGLKTSRSKFRKCDGRAGVEAR
jgi:hypothetical protein